MGTDLFDFHPSEGADAHRKTYCLVRLEILPLVLLQRPQRLFEDVAVHVDPTVTEKDKRRPLFQQEADLVRRHRLPVDLDDELGGNRLLRRLSPGVGGRAEIDGRGDRSCEIDAQDGIAGLGKIAGTAAKKALGLRAGEFDLEMSVAGQQSAQRPEDKGGLPERTESAAPFRHTAANDKAFGLGSERKDDGGPRRGILLSAAMPFREFCRKRGTFGVVPTDQSRQTLERHQPGIVEGLVLLILGVLAQTRDVRRTDIFVDPIVLDAWNTPTGVPAVLLLHEIGEEASLRHQGEGFTLPGAEFLHSGPPLRSERTPPPGRLRQGSSFRTKARRPAAGPRPGSRGAAADRE